MGQWRILHNATPIDIPAGQPRALLTYLLLHPDGKARRTLLVEELWPDLSIDRGRRYLTDALYRLRRAFGAAPILTDPEFISLDFTQTWWVDVWAFHAAAADPDPALRLASLDLYAPTLVPEIADHWILPYRIQLQERFSQVALFVADGAMATHDYTRAEALYRQTLEVDPLLEEAHRGLMRSLAQREQLAEALNHYAQFVHLLQEEMGVPPSTPTRALADQLYQELDLARRQAETRPTLRLIGRVTERTTLLTALDRARAGQAGLVVLLGAPGIGKTTLLRDLAASADWRGWQIYWGNGRDGLAPAPYAPLSTALNGALPAPRAAQVATSLPPIWLNLLARLLPPLQAVSLAQTYTLPVTALEGSHLPQALTQLLATLQTVAPLLLLLDDVQWGDPALWSLLAEIQPLLQQQRLLCVLSGRRAELQADATVWSQVEQWDRDGVAQIIALTGLPPEELSELAALYQTNPAIKGVPRDFNNNEANALHAASGGNPLFALELLSAGTLHNLLTTRPAIATLVTQRLHHLPAPARQAIGMAAILGVQLTYPDWESLWQRENPYSGALAPHAATLEQAGLLLIERNGYTFAHDLLHAAALADMDRVTQQRRHAAVLSFLAPCQDRTDPAVDLLRLLYHAQGAGDGPGIARYAQAAGEQALAAFAFARAEAHFTLALTQLDDTVAANRAAIYAALLGRIQARHLLARRSEQATDLAAIATLPLTTAQTVAVLTRRAEYQLVVGELVAAQSTVAQGLALAENVAPTYVAELHFMAGRIARDSKQLEAAQHHIQQAQLRYQQAGDTWGVAATQDFLGGLAWDQGDYACAARLHAQAADAFHALGDAVREAQSLNNLGSTYWELGQYAEARATHERSILVCRELGNKLSEGDNIDNLGGVAWALGDYTLAIRQYQAALALRERIDDRWGVAISLSNLGSAYRLQGASQQALLYYQKSLPLCQQVGRKRNEAYVLHGLGQTLLDLGRVEEAWSWLQQALTMRREIGDRTRLLETHIALLYAALARADRGAAVVQGEAIDALLLPTDRAALRQEAYLACFVLADHLGARLQACRWLVDAAAAQAELVAALPPADRERFLHNVPLNRELAAAVARYTTTCSVLLARGKEEITVIWTLVKPEDELLPTPTARRRHVLARLLTEAAAQDTIPTHDQLAAVLAVSRRTILRDLLQIDPD